MKLTATQLRRIIKEEVMNQAAKKGAPKNNFDISDDEFEDEEEDINGKTWNYITLAKFGQNPKPVRVFKKMKFDDMLSQLTVGGKPVSEGDSSVGSDPRGGSILTTVLEVGRRPVLIAFCTDKPTTEGEMAEEMDAVGAGY
jgi:hypothetical protein